MEEALKESEETTLRVCPSIHAFSDGFLLDSTLTPCPKHMQSFLREYDMAVKLPIVQPKKHYHFVQNTEHLQKLDQTHSCVKNAVLELRR